MSRYRRLAAALPLLFSALMSEGSWHGFVVAAFGGLVFWVPYWLAWWLSDGFASVQIGTGVDDGCGTGYRWGTQGWGYYRGGFRQF